MIISYEKFRLYAEILTTSEMDLVLCDEGHRLKNNKHLTYQALMGLKTKRRVLLSGTPKQDDLLEYYSIVNFVNPGTLSNNSEFKRHYKNPKVRNHAAQKRNGKSHTKHVS